MSAGTTAGALFADDRTVIAARVGGELKDLSYELADGDVVEGVEISSPDGLDILRHSTAHVMAQAVQELFPEAKLGIGPRSGTASTTTSTSRSRSLLRTSRSSRRRCRRSRSAASASPAGW